jgi:hypothetical protein
MVGSLWFIVCGLLLLVDWEHTIKEEIGIFIILN